MPPGSSDGRHDLPTPADAECRSAAHGCFVLPVRLSSAADRVAPDIGQRADYVGASWLESERYSLSIVVFDQVELDPHHPLAPAGLSRTVALASYSPSPNPDENATPSATLPAASLS